MPLEIRALGPLAVLRDGTPLELGGRKPRDLLAILAAQPNRAVTRDRLAEELWEGAPPPTAAGAIQVHVSHLRRALGPEARDVLVTEGTGYMLRVDAERFDVSRFEELLAEADSQAEPAVRAKLLAEALAAWRGAAFEGIAAPAARIEAARLEELRMRALELRIEADLAAGGAAELVAELERLTGEHPLHERFWGQRMLALYRAGRQADALACAQRLRRLLDEELGVDPSPGIQRLEQAILRQDSVLEPRTVSHGTGNLPFRLTTFVGRSEDVAELSERLDTARLVTVSGLGGIGKSRLALEIARMRQALGEDAWIVDVVSAGGGAGLLAALARAIGAKESPGRDLAEAVAAALAQRPTVVLLDAVEHDLSACVQLAASLLAACPRVRVLATGREPLRIDGELVWTIPPLAPAEAASLFVDRARLANPRISVEVDDPDVEALVETLDRMPLAIELAATHAAVLTVAEIRERLRSGSESADDSLRVALRWSVERLSAQDRRAFRRLGVAAGGAELEDVAALCGSDPVPIVARLTSLALLAAEPRDGHMRYRMLDTVRRVALEELSASREEDAVRTAQLQHLLRKLRSGGPAMSDGDADNVRGALAWAVDVDPDAALALAAAALPSWTLRGHLSEGRRWLERILAATTLPAESPVVIAARLGYGGLALEQGDVAEARRAFGAALEAARGSGDQLATARALLNLALAHAHQGEADAHDRLAEEALALSRALEDDHTAVRALNNLAMSARRRGDLPRAEGLCEEGAAAATRLGDPLLVVSTRMNHATVLRALGRIADARRRCEEALGSARESGYAKGIAACVGTLGTLALADGDHEAAERSFGEALELARSSDDKVFVAASLANLAATADARGDIDLAAARARESLEVASAGSDPRGVAQAHAQLAAYAVTSGTLTEAHDHLHEAERIRRELADREGLAELREIAARLADAEHMPDRALGLIGEADALRAEIGAGRDARAAAMVAEIRTRCSDPPERGPKASG